MPSISSLLFGESLLLPLAAFMGQQHDKITIDFLSKYWYKQEDFLLMVIEGIKKWILQLDGFPAAAAINEQLSIEAILKQVEKNKTVFNLLYFYFQYGLFYWSNLRQETRRGNVAAVAEYAWQQYCWPLFHVAANKYQQYEKLCLISTCIQHFSHPAIKEAALNKRAALQLEWPASRDTTLVQIW